MGDKHKLTHEASGRFSPLLQPARASDTAARGPKEHNAASGHLTPALGPVLPAVPVFPPKPHIFDNCLIR